MAFTGALIVLRDIRMALPQRVKQHMRVVVGQATWVEGAHERKNVAFAAPTYHD